MKLKRFISGKKSYSFDAVVIGGGITGAAVAYDLSLRGLSVGLVEKNDFGGGTSAATSKLIHGGLRYLATMEFGLVRESLSERRKLLNIAPNFVHPIATLVTTSRSKLTNTKLIIKAGMIMYDMLSLDKAFTWDKSKKLPCHRGLNPEQALELEPNIKREGLTGGAIYYDAASSAPERFTLAFIKSAVSQGASVANYAEVTSFINENEKVTGVVVHDKIKDRDVQVKGDLVINCGGPWADILLGIASGTKPNENLRRSEGIHLVTKKMVNDHVVGSLTPSGRHFFIIPWRGHALIGTTDKEYNGSPDDYRVTKESIQELLDDVNASFGNGDSIKYEDILYTYGGLRPLVEDQTEEVYESSRKYEIYDNANDGLDGLITVEGGKYTTSRNLALEVGKKVVAKLGRGSKKSRSDKHFLAGSEIPDLQAFMEQARQTYTDFNPETVETVALNYGKESDEVFKLARKKKALAETVTPDGEIIAEVEYAVTHEMAMTLSDIMFRRTGMGTLGHPGKKALKSIADTAARLLKWDEKRKKQEIKQVEKELAVPKN